MSTTPPTPNANTPPTPFAATCRASYAALRDRPNWETKPVGAAINGIGITARRRHVDNTLLLTLDVPSAEITVKDSAAELNPAAKAPGLLQHVENLYKDLPAYHQRLQAELDDLNATHLSPFEHADQLAAKRAELTALTAELRVESESQAGKDAAAAAQQRLTEAWREPAGPYT